MLLEKQFPRSDAGPVVPEGPEGPGSLEGPMLGGEGWADHAEALARESGPHWDQTGRY